MKTKKFVLLTASLVVLCLVFGFSSVAVAAPQDGQNGNGPPLKVTVMALYPEGETVFSGVESGVGQIGFVNEGLRWQSPAAGHDGASALAGGTRPATSRGESGGGAVPQLRDHRTLKAVPLSANACFGSDGWHCWWAGGPVRGRHYHRPWVSLAAVPG